MEEWTFLFAKAICVLIKTLKMTIANVEDSKQLIRSSGSIETNYIEANWALSKKDFKFRVKISRKEAKESVYWHRLISETNDLPIEKEAKILIQEATELKKNSNSHNRKFLTKYLLIHF